ncbi:MAG: copper chaperone [Sphingobacteriales bacterium]|nr:MAG: copper chaperone [Sphingobacteriales bacterium]
MQSQKFFYTILVLAFSTAFGQNAAAQSATAPSATQSASQTESKIMVKVSGITCGGDLKDIQKAILKVNGVTACQPARKASATSVFEVTYQPSIATEGEIRKAIEATPGCSNPNDRPYRAKF